MLDIVLHLIGPPGEGIRVRFQVRRSEAEAQAHVRRRRGGEPRTGAAALARSPWSAGKPTSGSRRGEMDFYGSEGTLQVGLLPASSRLFLRAPKAGYPAGWTTHEETRFNVSWLDTKAKHVWHAVQNRTFFAREADDAALAGVLGGREAVPEAHDPRHERASPRPVPFPFRRACVRERDATARYPGKWAGKRSIAHYWLEYTDGFFASSLDDGSTWNRDYGIQVPVHRVRGRSQGNDRVAEHATYSTLRFTSKKTGTSGTNPSSRPSGSLTRSSARWATYFQAIREQAASRPSAARTT